MAIEANISRSHHWFCGEDKVFSYTVYQADGTTPEDVTGWTFDWALRRRNDDADPAVLEKTSVSGISITGTYNADPAQNTQRVEVTIADTDTEDLPAGPYRHSLKRTDDGSETILSFGNAVLQRATAR